MKTHPFQLVIAYFVFLAINAPATVLYVDLNSTNATPPYTNWSTAAVTIQDAIDASSDYDQILVTNGIYETGGRVVYGSLTNRVAVTKPVTVQSVNGPEVTVIQGEPLDSEDGVSARCVYLTNNATLSGFTLTNGATSDVGDWDFDDNGGGVWCEDFSAVVTNCVITGNSACANGGGVRGGTLIGCTLTGNSASFSGGGTESATLNHCTLSANTAYYGGGADNSALNDCTLNANSAYYNGGGAASSTLNNCTLTGNSAEHGYGGGAEGGILNNCVLAGNSAENDYGGGGGTYLSMLNNCTLTGNSAYYYGGGAFYGTLNNCTLTGNSAEYGHGGGAYYCTLNNCTLSENSAYYGGGGAYQGTLNNCIVYYNTAQSGDDYLGGTLNYCCSTPLPSEGDGNITDEPLFINPDGGDYHLQSNSPCINSGNNAYAPSGPDLDGNPRVAGGTVDIGAYEFASPTSVISYAWLQQYDLSTSGSDDYADPDGDGMDNWKEWRTGTIPTDASSVLKMTTVTNDVSGVTVTWQSVTNRTYFLQRSSDLTADPAFETVDTDIPGQPDTTSYTDTDATGPGPYFYRVGVQ